MLSPVRSAFLPTIEKSQKPKESESALLHTGTLDNMKTRCEVAVARGFFEIGFVKLLSDKHRVLLLAKHYHV